LKKRILPYFLAIILIFCISVSAHQNGGDFAESDIGIWGVILIALGSGWLPMLVGASTYFLIKNWKDWAGEDHKWTDGISMGVVVFLIYDYLSLSGFLGLQDFKVGAASAKYSIIFLMISLVAIIFLGFAIFDKMENNDMTLYILWAVGLGFHSFSEGIIMGFNLQGGLAPALRFFPITSFLIHKYMEGLTLGALFLRRKEVTPLQVIGLSLLMGISIIPGVYVGYVVGGAVGRFIAYFYAASFASVMFIIPKFFPKNTENNMLKYYFGFGIGFIILYLGSLIHEL